MEKSIVPIAMVDGQINVENGERVVFERDGQEYAGVFCGSHVNPNGSVYLWGETLTGDREHVKLGRVWRAYTAKDEYFEQRIAEMGATNVVKRPGRVRKSEG